MTKNEEFFANNKRDKAPKWWESFVNRMELLRSGENLEKYCKRIGVSSRSYENWTKPKFESHIGTDGEYSYHYPRLENAIKICDEHNISLDWLILGSDYSNIGNEEIQMITGLSNDAIEMLRLLNNEDNPHHNTNQQSLDMLNVILESSYSEIKKRAKQEKMSVGEYNGAIITIFTFMFKYLNASDYVMDEIAPSDLRQKLDDRDNNTDWDLCQTKQTQNVRVYDKNAPDVLSETLNIAALLPELFKSRIFKILDSCKLHIAK